MTRLRTRVCGAVTIAVALLLTPTVAMADPVLDWNQILPGGETVLFTTGLGGTLSAIATMPVGGGAKRVIARTVDSPLGGGTVIGQGGGIAEARFISSGHLLYGQSTGIVRAIPFDLRSLSATADSLRFAFEAAQACGVGGEGRRKDLDGDGT